MSVERTQRAPNTQSVPYAFALVVLPTTIKRSTEHKSPCTQIRLSTWQCEFYLWFGQITKSQETSRLPPKRDNTANFYVVVYNDAGSLPHFFALVITLRESAHTHKQHGMPHQLWNSNSHWGGSQASVFMLYLTVQGQSTFVLSQEKWQ